VSEKWRVWIVGVGLLGMSCSGAQEDRLDEGRGTVDAGLADAGGAGPSDDDAREPDASYDDEGPMDAGEDPAPNQEAGADASGGDGDTDASSGSDSSTDSDTDAESDTGPALLPAITSFTGPANACAGSEIRLEYALTGASAQLSPGDVPVNVAGGHADVVLSETTTYTLTALDTAGGNPASAQVTVTAIPSPNATITAPQTAAHLEVGLTAQVPNQSQVTYAWSVLSDNATITAGANAAQATFSVQGTGSEVVLQVVVTSSVTSCQRTGEVHIPLPCEVPALVSQTAGTPEYVPADTSRPNPNFDVDGNGQIWAPRYVRKTGQTGALYDLSFARGVGGTWSVPAGSPATLNGAGVRVLSADVGVDNAGNAVFAWLETVDGNSFAVKLRGYSASAGWRAERTVGAAFDQAVPVHVQMDKADGRALVAWIQGPNNGQIPHVRGYDVISDTLGTDTPLRASTSNDYLSGSMYLDFQTNSDLDGFAVWFERDSANQNVSLHGVHFTDGLPDRVNGDVEVVTLVAGSQTYATDLMNFNSAGKNELRNVAVAENGNAAILWKVYNFQAAGDDKATYYARRYVGGAWQASEVVVRQPNFTWSIMAWDIDDDGNILALLVGNSGASYAYRPSAGAWSDVASLTTLSTSRQPAVKLAQSGGQGMLVFHDYLRSRFSLLGAFVDASAGTRSPIFPIDDPTEDASDAPRLLLDAGGKATLIFNQQPSPLPVGANSTNSNLQFATSCQRW